MQRGAEVSPRSCLVKGMPLLETRTPIFTHHGDYASPEPSALTNNLPMTECVCRSKRVGSFGNRKIIENVVKTANYRTVRARLASGFRRSHARGLPPRASCPALPSDLLFSRAVKPGLLPYAAFGPASAGPRAIIGSQGDLRKGVRHHRRGCPRGPWRAERPERRTEEPGFYRCPSSWIALAPSSVA